MTFNEQKWEKWQRLSEAIKDDVSGTVNDHALFTEFRKTVMSDPAWLDATMAGYFCAFVARSYLARAALGVRRHVKMDRGSLMYLLRDLEPIADQVSFEFYLTVFRKERIPWQEPTFRLLSDDGKTLSRVKVGQDIAALSTACDEIESYADRVVAHADPRGYAGSFTWGELDVAVDLVHEIAKRYLCVLTGQGYSTFEAVVQFDWARGFREPLLRPEHALVLPAEGASE